MAFLHSAIVLIELGAITLVMSILGRLARRIGLSPVTLYLVAGIAFGKGGLLPLATSEEFISVGAEIGVVLLLLLLGLEYSARELVTNLRAHTPDGLLDAVLNALPGAALALLLGWGPVAAVALAGVTWVSSSGVVAKVLADLGRLGNRETPVVLSILVIEDLAMAIYLPILTTLLAHASLAKGALTLLIALTMISFVLVVALRHGGLVSALVSAPDRESLLLGVLGLTLLVAGFAQQLQVSAAVGAFLVGIALSGPVAENATELLTPLRDLFAAVFFVFFGLSTDPATIPPVILPALGLAAMTILTKIVTGYLAARRAGIARPGRLRAGAVLIARGEFSIVIAGLAVAAGTEPRLGSLATAYVLTTVIAGPLIARAADPLARRLSHRRPRRVGHPEPVAASQGPPPGGEAPTPESHPDVPLSDPGSGTSGRDRSEAAGGHGDED